MAKKYSRERGRQRSQLPSRLMLITVSFFAGIIVASFFDINKVVALAGFDTTFNSALVPTPHFSKINEKQKPKLEFYTLLTKDEKIVPPPPPTQQQASSQPLELVVVNNNPVKPLENKLVEQVGSQPQSQPQVALLDKKDKYTIQVAAFKLRGDAEKLQASLLLKGFNTSIASTTNANNIWFRVIVGPFTSLDVAQKTKLALATQERLNGMIKKDVHT